MCLYRYFHITSMKAVHIPWAGFVNSQRQSLDDVVTSIGPPVFTARFVRAKAAGVSFVDTLYARGCTRTTADAENTMTK